MKKFVIVLLFVSVTMWSFSQNLLSFRVGFQFTGTSSWLMNKQVFDDGPALDVAPSWGRYFGPTVAVKFLKVVGVEVNLNFNRIKQNYTGKFEYGGVEINDYNSFISYNSFDIPVLVTIGNLVYFEAGPILHFFTKAKYNIKFTKTDMQNKIGVYNDLPYPCVSLEDEDVSANFKKFGFGAAIGFGVNVPLPKNIKINAGVRINYVFQDMQGVNGLLYTKDYGYDYNKPEYSNLRGSYTLTDKWFNKNEAKNFKNNPLYAGIRLGIIYEFGI